MAKWKKIGLRSYELNLPKAQAFVFGAHRPNCLWALSVYWHEGHFSRVENNFAGAKRRAEEIIAAVELGNYTPYQVEKKS
jgi:hypothetical protein